MQPTPCTADAPRRYRRMAARGLLRRAPIQPGILVTPKDTWPRFDSGITMEMMTVAGTDEPMFSLAYAGAYKVVSLHLLQQHSLSLVGNTPSQPCPTHSLPTKRLIRYKTATILQMYKHSWPITPTTWAHSCRWWICTLHTVCVVHNARRTGGYQHLLQSTHTLWWYQQGKGNTRRMCSSVFCTH